MMNLLVLAAVLVQPLVGLEKAERWSDAEKALYPLSEAAGRLEISVNACCGDGPRQILLKEPIPVPAGADLHFKIARPKWQSLFLKALVRDAGGQTFAVWTGGTYHLAKSNAFGGQFRPDIVMMQCGEWRATARLSSLTRENCTPVGTAYLPAKGALTFIGLELLPESKKLESGNKLWLRDFVFSDASHENSSFFYTFAGRPCCGEVDGDPVFSGLDVQAKTWGPKHVLDWELRETFDGKPFLQGSRVTEFPDWGKKGFEAPPLAFAVPQETFKVREEGSYWLHLRWATQWQDYGKPTARPGRIDDWTIRYDVFRGERPKAHAPVADAELNVAARERLAGQAKFRAEAVSGARPYAQPPLPSGEDIRVGGKSLVLFNPMVHNSADSAKHYTAMMDKLAAEGLRREIEISVTWREIERLPGVRDFRAVDEILDAAKARGFGCYVTFGTLVPPSWMPSWFTQNEEGRVFGHTIYLYNGGRFNVCHHPKGRQAALDFAAALCDHVKGHPALLGYFYLVEHGGDAEWAGWYEGYDEHARANFRACLKDRYGTVESLNAAWGVSFGSFAAVEPPHQKRPRAEDTPTRLRDWRDFKAYSLEKLQWDVVRTFRDRDPYRSIMVYGSPTLGMGLFDYSKVGVITANGGCAVPNRGYYMTAMAEAGMPQRAEEISCANWKAWGPTQLDVSFFNMLQGGGLMTHFKMFLPQELDLADTAWRERNGFDNFRKFIPIEAELRGAERLDDGLAGWTSSKGVTYGEWCYEMLLNSQLLVGTSVTPAWKAAKAVYVSETEKELRPQEVADLADYVRAGGHLYMTYRTGETVLNSPGARRPPVASLLSAFGISAPKKTWHRDWYFTGDVTEDSPWWPRAGGRPDAFHTVFRSPVAAPDDAGVALMRMPQQTYGASPALTRKAYGKGFVYVMWGDHYIPFTRSDPKFRTSKPFLAEIAADAGAPSPVRSTRREVFANLLKKGDVHYFLAMSPVDMPEAAEIALDLPSGCRTATDLVSGERQALPLRLKLGKDQVQVWRIE